MDVEVFVGHQSSLQKGDKAPDFKALNQFEQEIGLSQFTGKKVILFFYPKDNTPSCTNEACNLEENYLFFQQKGIEVLGVSADAVNSHHKFASKFRLNYSLLSDPDMNIIRAYDVWGRKKFMGRVFDGIIRTTFIIDEKGLIQEIINGVKTKEHSEQIKHLLRL